jgi:hypothetical protein
LFQSEILEDKEAAERLGITVRELKDIQAKSGEVETARLFLEELGVAFSDVQTLKEFYGSDKDPQTGRELDYVCPDVIATVDGQPIGIELTAFAPDEDDDRLSSMMQRVSDINRIQIASVHPELNGFSVHYSPNVKNIIRGRDVRQFVQQIVEFVKSEHRRIPFIAGEDRHLPERYSRASRPFLEWNLLEQYINSITIHYRPTVNRLPFSIYMSGLPRTIWTSIDHLSTKIRRKEKARVSAFRRGLSELWLLVHATGHPISSRAIPMFEHEIDRLLSSQLRQYALDAGFDHVFFWDGILGGYVDLVSGDSKKYAQ